jgi:hypothetical protein
MAKSFRPWDVDQVWLLPASIHDFVPPEHPAHLVRDLVRSELDLAAIVSAYQEERGQPPYHPAMISAAALCLQPRPVFLAADCPWLRGAARFPGGHGIEPAGLSYDQQFPQTASAGAG